jgi:hypothetical protein
MTNSLEYYINILSNSFISEITIPNNYLSESAIIELIRKYNWSIIGSYDKGCSIIKKKLVYNS